MEGTKTRNLYADLGLANRQATQGEIHIAYQELAHKLAPEKSSVPGSTDAADLSKIHSAYDILGDPEKRAKYDQSCRGVQCETKITPTHSYEPGRTSPLDKQFRAARAQLKSKKRERARARRASPRAQLRVRAQLQAHAPRIERLHQLSKVQGLREAIRQVGVGSVNELEQVWSLMTRAIEAAKAVKENNKRSQKQEKAAVARVLARLAAKKEERVREEAAREKEAAEKARTEEIDWIKNEATESIRVLAGMEKHPAPKAIGYHQMVFEEYVRGRVEKTDDLLEYLWDKVHSGTWICPELKAALDLDEILGPVLQLERSYFPSSTKHLAASLLRNWRGENCDETGKNPRASDSQEAGRQPCSDSLSSAEGGDAKKQLPGADSQLYPQATEQKPSPFAKKTYQSSPYAQNTPQTSPFAQTVRQTSPFAQNVQPKSPFALDKRQYSTGAPAPVAGSKRMRSPYGDQGGQRSKIHRLRPSW